MSYREQRNLSEMARTLGYPRIVSVENFRVPNFKLVAEILEWIVKRFEPSVLLSSDCRSEEERVLFIKTAVVTLLQTARLKLNPKKLYQADAHAVQELLIPMRILHAATRDQPADELAAQWNAMKGRLNSKMQEVRMCQQLSTQLPQTGAVVSDLLGKDIYLRKERHRATMRTVSVQEAERAINLAMQALATETDEIENKLTNIAHDEQVLDEKIERRKREYEQMQKRYAKLQTFRPAHQDEYEKYEAKLKEMYDDYVIKFRCFAFLKQLCSEMERVDQQRNAEAERNMRSAVERMRSEQKEKLAIEESKEAALAEEIERRPRRVFGNMVGAGLSDDDDDEDDDDDDRPQMMSESALDSDRSEREVASGAPHGVSAEAAAIISADMKRSSVDDDDKNVSSDDDF